mgnify:CR=1 FL=1
MLMVQICLKQANKYAPDMPIYLTGEIMKAWYQEFYPSWIFNATPASYKHTAVSSCLHSLQGISSGTKDATNEVVLEK